MCYHIMLVSHTFWKSVFRNNSYIEKEYCNIDVHFLSENS